MCDKCNYQKWLNDIGEMLLDESYSFAENTLLGIRTWIVKNKHITPKQCEAVENIRNAIEERDDHW